MGGLVQVHDVALVTVIGTATVPNLQVESAVGTRLAPYMIRKVPPVIGPPRGETERMEKGW